MHYDVVIATRNRPQSLLRCIQCIEAQTELPVRVIIVDASDDSHGVREVAMAGRSADIQWIWLESPTRSTAFQRNLGLEHVESEVVLMPDDDSLLYPMTGSELMRAYRLDSDRRIAGVSALGVSSSPIGEGVGQISRESRFRAKVLPLRNRVERFIAPRPFETHPHSLWKQRTFPSWVDGDAYVPVETIGGYLLSLRADCAKEARFDETLGYGVGYALHEDMEMSLRLQNDGYLLIAAHRAHIFHDVHPGKRANGFPYGFCWIANYIYTCSRDIPRDSREWRQLGRFIRYKILLYRFRALLRNNEYNQDVLRGAVIAWKNRAALIDASPGELASAYKALCDRWLPSVPSSGATA